MFGSVDDQILNWAAYQLDVPGEQGRGLCVLLPEPGLHGRAEHAIALAGARANCKLLGHQTHPPTNYAPDGPAVTVAGAELATAPVALPHPASSMLLKYTRLH